MLYHIGWRWLFAIYCPSGCRIELPPIAEPQHDVRSSSNPPQLPMVVPVWCDTR